MYIPNNMAQKLKVVCLCWVPCMFLLLPNEQWCVSLITPALCPALAYPTSDRWSCSASFYEEVFFFFHSTTTILRGRVYFFLHFFLCKDLSLTWTCSSNNTLEFADSLLFPKAEVQGWGVWEVCISIISAILFLGKNNILFPWAFSKYTISLLCITMA